MIDLKKYAIRTDLAVESLEEDDLGNLVKYEENGISVSSLVVDKTLGKKINKKEGDYTTIEFLDITDFDNREKVGKVFQKELKKILFKKNITDNMSALVIGLGNEKSAPDSLGPKVVKEILVTRHLFELNVKVNKNIRIVSSFAPGVMGVTGIETSNIIKSLVDTVKPDFLIVIDALASSSIDRLNKTIQITTAGISPGSGVSNKRKEISEEIYHIPVIAIGIPTVVDAPTIISDSINSLFKYFSYLKDNLAKSKLSLKKKIGNKDNLSNEEKKELLGILGTLSDKDKKSLLKEILISDELDLIVTPKEIDFLIDKMSSLISSTLNNTLHKDVTHY